MGDLTTDRSGRTLKDYRELYWQEKKRITELEGMNQNQAEQIDDDVKHITELEARLEVVKAVGFHTHPSWNCNEEFDNGWNECRKQIEEALGGAGRPK